MGKVFALANQKGGVGKTTTAVNVAACLAEAGASTLVVDLDPQANATSGLGEQANGTSTYDLLDGAPLDELAHETAVPNLYLVPSRPELAGAVPVSGSSYSYAYATLGELVAMGVAACLLLEYGVSGAAVAVGWSQYLNQLLDNLFGLRIPDLLSQSPEGGGLINLPAVVLVAMCALLLIRGGARKFTRDALSARL